MFSAGIIIPVIKDKSGVPGLLDNYRPITLTFAMFKLFENLLLELFGQQIISNDLQFGFEKKLRCPSAIFFLRQLNEFFNSRRSNVYKASLDASKTIDRVNNFRFI